MRIEKTEERVENVAAETTAIAPTIVKRRAGGSMSKARKREMLFYTAFIVFPILQFVVFYAYVNFDSFLLAFQSYDEATLSYKWVGWKNFNDIFVDLSLEFGLMRRGYFTAIRIWLLNLCLAPLELLVPFYIYKKMPGSGLFKVLLYMPSILSTMVLGLLYQYVVDQVVPEMALDYWNVTVSPLLNSVDSRFWAAWGFAAFMKLGHGILLYTSEMSRIPVSLVEYGQLEGCTPLKEFWYVTLPLIFPLYSVFLIATIKNIFVDNFNLYTFFGKGSTEVTTIGYYKFCLVVDRNPVNFPLAAALGMFSSLIILVPTLFSRWLTNKLDAKAQF